MCGEESCERKTHSNGLHSCESERVPRFGGSGRGAGGTQGLLAETGAPKWETAEEADKAGQKGQAQDPQTCEPHNPESGHMKRPGKPRGQHYLSLQTTDTDHGIITGVTVTPGDVYDSVPKKVLDG